MPSLTSLDSAPELDVSQWFNTSPLKLADLRGQVVVLHAFQMLCPGCVLHGTPLAQRIHDRFHESGITVIGIHTVFEHHQAMQPVSLQAYLHEFRITMPVAVDRQHDELQPPATMSAFNMRGTPTMIVIDRNGYIRHHHFGQLDEMALGIEIGQLLPDRATQPPN